MGLNAAARLKDEGVPVRKTDVLRVPLDDFFLVSEGLTAHPRRDYPVDPELLAISRATGVPGKFLAKERPQKRGAPKFEIIDGARRDIAGLVAQDELRKTAPGKRPLVIVEGRDPRGCLLVELDLYTGEDGAELIRARIRANRGGLPDSLCVLAAQVIALVRLGVTDASEIVPDMPRGIGPAEVEALGRWKSLSPALRERFDALGVAHVGLLRAVLAAPEDEQEATLEKLLASRVKSTRAATRAVRAEKDKADPWARRMSPRKVRAVAEAVHGAFPAKGRAASLSEAAFYLASGMRLAAGHDVPGVLDLLPKVLRKVIVEARTAKKGRAS